MMTYNNLRERTKNRQSNYGSNTDLFGDPKPERPWKIPALTGYAYIVEPFDFERDGDHARTIPDPNYRPPEWLSLPTDDPAWMPEQYRLR